MAKEEAIEAKGRVKEALANTQFRIELDNGIEVTALQRHRAYLGGGAQVVRRHAHVEEHLTHTVHRVDDVAGTGEVADDHLGAHRPQMGCAVDRELATLQGAPTG